jgi:phosphoglycolate phosphatase
MGTRLCHAHDMAWQAGALETSGRRIDSVIVDISGTLVYDDEAVAAALVEALGVFGGMSCPDLFQDGMSFVAHTRGLPVLSVLRSLLGDEDQAQYAYRAFELALPSVLAQGGVRAVPGAEDTLAALRQAGRRVCLMSRYTQPGIDAIVDALGWHDLVDLAVAPAPGTRTPPHPDLVLNAIVRMGVTAVHEVALVAESANALVAGTRAGATAVIGVLTGAHALTELECIPHTHVVESITDVPALLELVSTRVHAA